MLTKAENTNTHIQTIHHSFPRMASRGECHLWCPNLPRRRLVKSFTHNRRRRATTAATSGEVAPGKVQSERFGVDLADTLEGGRRCQTGRRSTGGACSRLGNRSVWRCVEEGVERLIVPRRGATAAVRARTSALARAPSLPLPSIALLFWKEVFVILFLCCVYYLGVHNNTVCTTVYSKN